MPTETQSTARFPPYPLSRRYDSLGYDHELIFSEVSSSLHNFPVVMFVLSVRRRDGIQYAGYSSCVV